ncbi:unnamed protein product [Closterium sp. NIES-65]|nr:unnamed protein product [Closterium sp. NIES-65]
MASSSDSSVDLATVDALELLPDNSAANWHSYAHSVEVLLSSVVVSGYNLRSVVFQEGGGLQPVAPTAPTGPAPAHPGAEPSPPSDPPTFAPNVNDPQSSETAIRTYRTNLQEHLRLQLRYEDDRRIYDDAAARYNKYQEDLDTYTAELADYTTKINAWRVADRRALAILLATIPSSLKRELTFLLLPPVATASRPFRSAGRCHSLRPYQGGQCCGQTTHATETCFKALSDEWFARGNTGTPPRWSALNPRPTPLEVRSSPLYEPPSSTHAHQALAPPHQQHQQQQQQQQLGNQQQGSQHSPFLPGLVGVLPLQPISRVRPRRRLQVAV